MGLGFNVGYGIEGFVLFIRRGIRLILFVHGMANSIDMTKRPSQERVGLFADQQTEMSSQHSELFHISWI